MENTKLSMLKIDGKRSIRMNEKEITKQEDRESTVTTTEISKDVFASVFRLLFAGEDSLFELYTGPIIIGKQDLEVLNVKILEKLRHYEVQGLTFTALAGYENRRSQEYSSWGKFCAEDWSTPDILDSLSLTWNFAINFPKSTKPTLHSINVRISSSIKPQHLIQAIFSKNPEDIEKIDLKMVPMHCRVSVVDHILSQELLDIVSKWHKGLRNPEYIFPLMKKIMKHSEGIRNFIQTSIPVLSTTTCFGYYYKFAKGLNPNITVTAGLMTDTVLWLGISAAVVFISVIVGKGLSSYMHKHLLKFGSFTVFEITNGDKKRQTFLQARSANSYWKFIGSSFFALLWNIIGGIITALLFKN